MITLLIANLICRQRPWQKLGWTKKGVKLGSHNPKIRAGLEKLWDRKKKERAKRDKQKAENLRKDYPNLAGGHVCQLSVKNERQKADEKIIGLVKAFFRLSYRPNENRK